jgi:hypothetical protein
MPRHAPGKSTPSIDPEKLVMAHTAMLNLTTPLCCASRPTSMANG